MKFNFIFLAFLFILSMFISIFGLGSAYYSEFKPNDSHEAFYKIGGDRWIQEGSKINLKNLASRGNKLILNFGPWHPPTAPKAKLRVSLCGKIVSEFEAYPGSSQTLYLTANCKVKTLSFSVLNPVMSVSGDERKLGAQLKSAKVTSKIGVPILNPLLILKVSLLILSISILINFSFKAAALGMLYSVFSQVFLYLILANIKNFELWKFDSVLFWSLAIAIGFFSAISLRTIKENERLERGIFLALFIIPIFIIAFYLRYSGLDFGFPSRYHPDEVPKFNAIMRMLQYGDLNPRYFLHPSMLLYSTYFSNWVMNSGLVSNNFSDLIYSGRIISFLAGSLSVLLTYLIAKNLFSKFTGIISALILAIVPLHIVSSRYVKEDALLLFFILACTYFVVISAKKDNKFLFIIAALLAGLAASVKYSGILCICILFAAPFIKNNSFKPRGDWILLFIFGLLLVPIGFLIGTPYSVLDYPTFINDFSHEKSHMIKGHSSSITAFSQYWLYHLSRSIYTGMGSITAFISVIGLGVLIRKFTIHTLFIVCCFLLFYLPAEWVNAKPAPQPERYIVPCLPFLAIAGGYFIERLLRDKRLKVPAILLIILIVIVPLTKTLKINNGLKPDTRDEMASWIRSNLPKDSTIFVDWKPYSPQGLEEEYKIEYLPRSKLIPSLTIDELNKRDGYLIMSSLYYDRFFNQPESEPMFREVIKEVFRNYKIIKHVENSDAYYGFHNPRLTILNLDKKSVDEDKEKVEKIIEGLPTHEVKFFGLAK